MRMPEVVEVEEIPELPPEREQEEIFEEVKPSKKKVEIKNDIEEIQESEPQPEPKEEQPKEEQPKEQKPIKKKRVMTEKQKEALRKGREKSLETRRQLKAKKDEVNKKKKQIKELEKEKVEIQYNKAVNQLEEVKDRDRDFVPNPNKSGTSSAFDKPKKEVEPPTPRTMPETKKYYLTEDEINNISTKAINNYEIIRKTRKEEKRRKQEQEKAEAEIAKTIRAYNSTYTMRF